MQLGATTWPEVERAGRQTVLLVPLGSLEQHGPHLPLDTDSRIAAAVAASAAASYEGLFVAPPLAYGASGEHAGFPGTLLLGHSVLVDVLVELVRSARAWCAGVVLVSAHGGNEEALVEASRRSAGEGDDVLAWRVAPRGGDAHAGRTETSLLLAIEPSAVRTELAQPGCTEALASLLPRLRREGVRPLSSSGVLGDPTGASREEGRAILATLAGELSAAVADRWPGTVRPVGAPGSVGS